MNSLTFLLADCLRLFLKLQQHKGHISQKIYTELTLIPNHKQQLTTKEILDLKINFPKLLFLLFNKRSLIKKMNNLNNYYA